MPSIFLCPVACMQHAFLRTQLSGMLSCATFACSKEARKKKLKESAAKMKETGATTSAFGDSKYGLPEDATSPNMRALAVRPLLCCAEPAVLRCAVMCCAGVC